MASTHINPNFPPIPLAYFQPFVFEQILIGLIQEHPSFHDVINCTLKGYEPFQLLFSFLSTIKHLLAPG